MVPQLELDTGVLLLQFDELRLSDVSVQSLVQQLDWLALAGADVDLVQGVGLDDFGSLELAECVSKALSVSGQFLHLVPKELESKKIGHLFGSGLVFHFYSDPVWVTVGFAVMSRL